MLQCFDQFQVIRGQHSQTKENSVNKMGNVAEDEWKKSTVMGRRFGCFLVSMCKKLRSGPHSKRVTRQSVRGAFALSLFLQEQMTTGCMSKNVYAIYVILKNREENKTKLSTSKIK